QVEPGIRLSDLLGQPEMAGRADDLYQLVALNDLFIDLRRDAIAEYRTTRVFLDAAIAAAYQARRDTRSATGLGIPTLVEVAVGARIDWDQVAWDLINTGPEVSLRQVEIPDRIVRLPRGQF